MRTILHIARNRKTVGAVLSIALLAIGVNRSGGTDPPAAKSASLAGAAGELTTNDTLGARLRQSPHGEVLVVQVRKKGAAHLQGIRPGDQILSIDRAHIASIADVDRALREHDPHHDLKIVVKSSTQPRYIRIAAPKAKAEEPKSAQPAMAGVTLNVKEGRVTVGQLYSGGPAEKAGVRSGDIIESIDGHAVANEKDALELLRGYKAGNSVQLQVERNGWRRSFTVVFASRADVAGRPLVTERAETTSAVQASADQAPVVTRVIEDDDWLDSDEYEDISDPYRRALDTDFDG